MSKYKFYFIADYFLLSKDKVKLRYEAAKVVYYILISPNKWQYLACCMAKPITRIKIKEVKTSYPTCALKTGFYTSVLLMHEAEDAL